MFTVEFLRHTPNRDREAVRPVLDRLIQRYIAPGRAYHNLAHVERGLHTHQQLDGPPLSAQEFMAWAYHDTYYEILGQDNEERSVAIFLRDNEILGFNQATADVICSLIASTSHREEATNVVQDLDLSILGSLPAAYQQYVKALRKEYTIVPEEAWRKGRAVVLKEFLDRRKLYATPPYVSAFHELARENMRCELLALL